MAREEGWGRGYAGEWVILPGKGGAYGEMLVKAGKVMKGVRWARGE